MFVERSAARIRVVRTLFVFGCLLPTLGLAGWAAYRHSSAALDPLLAEWSASVGFVVEVDTVEHLRPSVVRVHNLLLQDATGRRVAGASEAEVEERQEGTLLLLPKLGVDRFAVASFAAAAHRWLTEPVRFPRGGAIRIEELSWNTANASRILGGFRIEFVVVGTDRAIRIRRDPDDDDELRLRLVDSPEGLQLEALLTCERGLPAELVAAASGWLPRFGPQAIIQGQLVATASCDVDVERRWQWSGRGKGMVTGVDLAALAAAAGQAAQGEAVLRVESLSLEAGRITAAAFLLSSDEGAIGRGLFERMVAVLGCRPGPAAPRVSGADWLAGPVVPFEKAAVAIELDRSGMVLKAAGLGGATLVAARGEALLEAAGEAISFERFAWLFAAPATDRLPATIPASSRALEVLSRLPIFTEGPGGKF
jgi:hypothetical protein